MLVRRGTYRIRIAVGGYFACWLYVSTYGICLGDVHRLGLVAGDSVSGVSRR